MHASTRFPLAAALAAILLGGCAVGQRLGWTATTDRGASDDIRASCEESTRTLKGRPDYDTALGACLEAMTRQHLRG